MIKVMISGITNYEDALSATNLGVDFVGFDLIKESPKKVSDKMLKQVNEKLPPFVLAVATVANLDQKQITKLITKLSLKAICLNGEETPEFCKALSVALGVKIFKKFEFSKESDLLSLQPFINNIDYFILDITNKDENGNVTVDIELLKKVNQLKIPFFINGNIKFEKIAEIVEQVLPFGIIADESVERLQRRKDFNKMADFIKNVHSL